MSRDHTLRIKLSRDIIEADLYGDPFNLLGDKPMYKMLDEKEDPKLDVFFSCVITDYGFSMRGRLGSIGRDYVIMTINKNTNKTNIYVEALRKLGLPSELKLYDLKKYTYPFTVK